ncbi:MAG TPA: DUF2250 domain-containing protein [candidate division Zixibacteria bacterium]|nr:DUF2250 domain-containing protein [candidate division Zixibacteria bacterium]
MKLKDDYILAKCCSPTETDSITGYYSYDNYIKVHKSDCPNVRIADQSRLIELEWPDIIAVDDFVPESDYDELDEIDFLVMNHHKIYGVDYSLKVAAMINVDKKAVFDSHRKLRAMKLLERVKPLMIQYRKGIAKNKWIKHRNHTYYNLTDKGKKYLEYSGK